MSQPSKRLLPFAILLGVALPGAGFSQVASDGFLPEIAVVELGTRGGKITLVSTEAGGWTLNGDAFASGQVVEGDNAAGYRLTLADGIWMAEYIAPGPAVVPLGSSGEFVRLHEQEDGSVRLDSGLLPPGRVVTASSGSRYRLDRSLDGVWTAVFVQPRPKVVRLGDSPFVVGVEVLEGGRYWLQGRPLADGEIRDLAGAGRYRFSLGPDGDWTAQFAAVPVRVRLGEYGGTIELTPLENGAYQLGLDIVRSGDTVVGSNGHEYTLVLFPGYTSAEPLPLEVPVSAQGAPAPIVLTRMEDGTYWLEGRQVRSGDLLTVGSVRYRFTYSGGTWSATSPDGPVPVVPPDPGGPLVRDTLETYVGVRSRLREADGSGSRAGTRLEIEGVRYSLATLSETRYVGQTASFADNARDRISDLLFDIEALLDLGDRVGSLDRDIEARWDQIGDELETLFPGERSRLLARDVPKHANNSIDAEELLDDIADVLEALGSEAALEDAVEEGIFQDARISSSEIEDVFDLDRSVEEFGFGWTRNTRFGAYHRSTRDRASGPLTRLAGDEGLGSFAYSPLDRARTTSLAGLGEAVYSGQTIAAGEGNDLGLYFGEIDLRVRFTTKDVTAFVSGLRNRAGEAWTYSFGEVDTIRLSDATLHSSNGSFGTSGGSPATVTYAPVAGSPGPRSLSGEFEGQFLGQGSQSADAVIGTWTLESGSATLLTGAFGAERGPAQIADPLPPAILDEGRDSLTFLVNQPDSRGDITIGALDPDGDEFEFSAAMLYRNGGVSEIGDTLMEVASDALAEQLELLRVYRTISNTSTTVRQALWDAANRALEDHVFDRFGSDPLGRTYPAGSTLDNRDAAAVELLEDAIAALASPLRFEDSLRDGGVFEGEAGSESRVDGLDFDDIHRAVSYEVIVEFGHTDYTRFGAWGKTQIESAIGLQRRNLPNSERPDVFAYSPLQPTVFEPGDPNFPRNFVATYEGATRAVDSGSSVPEYYDASVRISVDWDDTPQGSEVWAVISGMASLTDGDYFVHNDLAVAELRFTGMRVRLDSGDRVEFASSSPSVRVRYLDPFRTEASFSGTRRLEGKFLGASADGPIGLIGTWRLGDVIGAYGADLVP